MTSNDSPRYFKPFESGLPTEELEITRLIFERLAKENCLAESERETIAYRIAEIMVTCKQMFTRSLPRLTNVNGESSSSVEDDLTGLQMTFTHLCDLMYEFDSAFLEAIRPPQDPQPDETEDEAAGEEDEE
ncbi:MAG: hypothetical protein WC314_20025 [Vulcanimicrobiota bacterium]